MSHSKRLEISLLLLRLSVFLVMFIWTIDKFLNPEHSARVASKFYFFPADTGAAVFYALGAVQLVIVLAFVAGAWKRISYGLVLLMHGVSTFSSYARYADPFNGNLLFFAAWPMLAACVALYLLRDADTLLRVARPQPAA